MLEKPDRFEQYIKDTLTNEYGDGFSATVELDYERKLGCLIVDFDEVDGNPELNYFVDDIAKELRIEEPTILSEFKPEEEVYELGVESPEQSF